MMTKKKKSSCDRNVRDIHVWDDSWAPCAVIRVMAPRVFIAFVQKRLIFVYVRLCVYS